MKTPHLIPLLSTFSAIALAADPIPPVPGEPAATSSSSSSVTTTVSSGGKATGKATITIEVNGKKVTREVELGKTEPVHEGANAPKGDSHNAREKGVKPMRMRTWLGVATGEPSDDLRAQLPIPDGTGVQVREVLEGSPAAKSGLQTNDVLVRLDDQILTNSEQLRSLIGTKKQGETVHVTYLRKGQEATAEIRLAEHPEELAATGSNMLNNLLKEATSGVLVKAGPVVVNKSGTIGPNGDFTFSIETNTATGKEEAEQGEAPRLSKNPAVAEASDAIQQMEKALRAAGASDEAIANVREAIANGMRQMQKAFSDGKTSKEEIQRNLQKAMDEMRRSIQEAWRPIEGEASKQSDVSTK